MNISEKKYFKTVITQSPFDIFSFFFFQISILFMVIFFGKDHFFGSKILGVTGQNVLKIVGKK